MPSAQSVDLITIRFGIGIISNSLWLLENLAKKTSIRFAFEVLVSLRLKIFTSPAILRDYKN
jgi:hypothetical protein